MMHVLFGYVEYTGACSERID